MGVVGLMSVGMLVRNVGVSFLSVFYIGKLNVLIWMVMLGRVVYIWWLRKDLFFESGFIGLLMCILLFGSLWCFLLE